MARQPAFELQWHNIAGKVGEAVRDMEGIVHNALLASGRKTHETEFTRKATAQLKYLINRLDTEKLSRYYPSRADWKIIFDKTYSIARNRLFGELRESIRFSALNQLSLLAGEIVSPLTEEFFRKPKHPSRDHVVHVLVVLSLGWRFINPVYETNLKTLDNIVQATMASHTWQWIVEICDGDNALDDQETVKKVVVASWAVAALCHDMAYTDEIQSWLTKNTCIDSFLKSCVPGNTNSFDTTRKRLIGAIRSLTKGNPELEQKLNNGLLNFYRETKTSDTYYDHGQLSASLLLSYYAEKSHLRHLIELLKEEGNLALPVILLASFAMFDHDRFGTARDEKLPDTAANDIRQRSTAYFQRNPLAVLLAFCDLLGEGLRLAWKVCHEDPIISSDLYTRSMLLYSFIGIREMTVEYLIPLKTYLVTYECQNKPSLPNFKYSGKSYSSLMAIYEEKQPPPLDWKQRRQTYISGDMANIPEKERRLLALWSSLSRNTSYVFVRHR